MSTMKDIVIAIEEIYVPMKRRKTLDPRVVEDLAEDILENGQIEPILLRKDEGRYVLVEGLHRLEACRALGENTIIALLVHARRH